MGRPGRPGSGRPRGLALLAGAAARPRGRLGAGDPAPRTARARSLATGPGRGRLARGRLRAAGRDRAARPTARSRASRRGSPAHDGMATRLAGVGRRRATTCGSSSSRCAGRSGCSTTRPTASPLSAWSAQRTAAGWPAAAPIGCRAGRAAGRSARAARWTSARAPPRRSPASFRRSGSSGPTTCRSRRSVTLPNGLHMLVGLATVPNGCEPVPDAEHDEWAWWPRRHGGWPPEADDRLKLMAQT